MAGGEEKGERQEPGWSRVMGELCRAYAVTLGTGGDAGRQLPLPLLRDLAWFNPCLAAPGGSGQSLLAPGKSVLGSVAGVLMNWRILDDSITGIPMGLKLEP